MGAAATNLTNELLSIPKQVAAVNAGHVFTGVFTVLPQVPLKSQIATALLHSEVEGMVLEQAGKLGG